MNSRTFFSIFLIVADTLSDQKHRSTILLKDKYFRNYTKNFEINNSFNRTIIELRPAGFISAFSAMILLIEL